MSKFVNSLVQTGIQNKQLLCKVITSEQGIRIHVDK